MSAGSLLMGGNISEYNDTFSLKNGFLVLSSRLRVRMLTSLLHHHSRELTFLVISMQCRQSLLERKLDVERGWFHESVVLAIQNLQ